MNLTKRSLVISLLPSQHQCLVPVLWFPGTGIVQTHYCTLNLIKCENLCVTWCSGPYLGPKWEAGLRSSNHRNLTQPRWNLNGLPFCRNTSYGYFVSQKQKKDNQLDSPLLPQPNCSYFNRGLWHKVIAIMYHDKCFVLVVSKHRTWKSFYKCWWEALLTSLYK